MPVRNGPAAPTRSHETPHLLLVKSGEHVELTREARRLGRGNLPISSAVESCELEVLIRHEHERRHAVLAEQTHTTLREHVAVFKNLEEQLPRKEDLANVRLKAEADLERETRTDQSLIPVRQEQQRRRRDLRLFVTENGIGREPQYPESRMFELGIVAVVVLMESVANLSFFAPASNLGLLGGFLQAVAVALANAILGVLAGFFPARHLRDAAAWVRRLSVIGLVAYGVVAVCLNLGVARWRDLVISHASTDQGAGQLLINPWNLSLPSAVLFMVGLAASGICLWKGFRLDDPIPGYADVHRRFVEADRAYDHCLEIMRGRVIGRVELIGDGCEAVVRNAKSIVESMESVVGHMQQAAEEYKAGRQREEASCNRLLKRFRDENRAVRTTPAPSYFALYGPLPSQLDSRLLADLSERVQSARGRLEELRVEQHRISEAQRDRIVVAAERFHTLVRHQLERADAGRGDGGESVHEPLDGVS